MEGLLDFSPIKEDQLAGAGNAGSSVAPYRTKVQLMLLRIVDSLIVEII